MLAILAECAALPAARRHGVGWLESFARTKSACAHDMLGHGAGGVTVDAPPDALDHDHRHGGRLAGTGSRTFVARQKSIDESVA